MNIKINKGKHSPNILTRISHMGFYIDRTIHPRIITFKDNCKYNFNNDDQLDINKIFGITLGLNHHENSIRVGWRWDIKTNSVELVSYVYLNNVRQPEKHICFVKPNTKIHVDIVRRESKTGAITITKDGKHFGAVHFDVDGPFFGYLLGAYFGGNNPAPHQIEIEVEK